MNFSDKQQEKLQFQNKFQAETSGVPKHASSLARKRETLIRTYEEPVLPKVAKILFVSMVVLTLVMIAVDLKNGLPYINQSGLKPILQNMSQSALLMWGIYTVLISLVCGIGIAQNKATVLRKAKEGNVGEWTNEDVERTRRSARRLNASYRQYLLVSIFGTIFWAMCWIVICFFA